jgi:hypothetical protein
MKPFNLSQRIARSPVNVLDVGVIGDNVTDDTAAFQAACNMVAGSATSRSLFIPGDAVIRLTAPITFTRPIRIFGEGVVPYLGAPTGNSRGPGSWLHFAHGGKGLVFSGISSTPGPSLSGVQLELFGTFRDQPALTAAWADDDPDRFLYFKSKDRKTPETTATWVPNDHDFDIFLESTSAELERLMFLGVTRGIGAFRGNYGRFSARRIEGHFFKIGINLDKQYDVAIIEHFRSWSYWADNPDVWAYTRLNLDSLYLERVDNPMISNAFSINHRAGLRIGQSADETVGTATYPGGTTSKLKANNIDCDVGQYGLWLDTTNTAQVLADITNFAVQSLPTSGSCGVMLEAASSRIGITNFDCRTVEQNAIRAVTAGASNWVDVSGRIFVDNWNTNSAAFQAFVADGSNTIFLHSEPWATNGHGGGIYGGAAKSIFVGFSEDAAGHYVTVPQGGSVALPTGAGLVALGLIDYGNDCGVYAYGGGPVAMLTPAGRWVASTTTPAAAHISVAFNGGGYSIYNNLGQAVKVSMAGLRTGEGS